MPGISVCPPVHCTSVLYPRFWMEKICAFGGYTTLCKLYSLLLILRISLLFKPLGVASDPPLQLIAMYPNTPTWTEDNPTKGRAGRSWVALGRQPLQDKDIWPRFSEDLGTKSDGTIVGWTYSQLFGCSPGCQGFDFSYFAMGQCHRTGEPWSTSRSYDPGLVGAGLLT